MSETDTNGIPPDFWDSADDLGTLRWFGPAAPQASGPALNPRTRIDPPVGVTCHLCTKPILLSEFGIQVPHLTRAGVSDLFRRYHRSCFVRWILPKEVLDSARTSVTCPQCQMTSHNPKDVGEGYCGNCHDWTSPATIAAPREP